MHFKCTFLLAALGLALAAKGVAAAAPEDKETDPLVLKKLEWFQDQKFGFIVHWGMYSQWG